MAYSSVVIAAVMGGFGIILLVASIISLVEREGKAAVILLTACLADLGLAYLLVFSNFGGKGIIAAMLVAMLVAAVYLFVKKPILPIGYKRTQPRRVVDEIDTIFARMNLKPNTQHWNDYYANHPHQDTLDAKARSLPGLLSDKSLYYQPFVFSSAQANFEIIEYLHKAINHPLSKNSKRFEEENLSRYVKSWAKHLGAHSIGITEVQDYHLYTKRGRGENIGKPVEQKHKLAIAFTVEMNVRNVQSAPASSMIFESSQQYLKSAIIALQLATFLKNLGYDSRAHIDGDYEVICPLVARDAGLGEIGRMGLLMTPKLGPRARIAIVTTNAPLQVDKAKPDPSVTEFCTFCKKCADCCPGRSIPFDNMKEVDGVLRWQINSEACYRYWCISGTDCGRCISVCPFSHPNNILHNSIRHLISRSRLIARFAYIADDLLYGRKPKPKEIPRWMGGVNPRE